MQQTLFSLQYPVTLRVYKYTNQRALKWAARRILWLLLIYIPAWIVLWIILQSVLVYITWFYNIHWYVIILSSLRSLQQLEVLDILGNNFSKGLPDVVSQLSSLRELHLYLCQLEDLPQRWVYSIYKYNLLSCWKRFIYYYPVVEYI
jgi:hypothetical protein